SEDGPVATAESHELAVAEFFGWDFSDGKPDSGSAPGSSANACLWQSWCFPTAVSVVTNARVRHHGNHRSDSIRNCSSPTRLRQFDQSERKRGCYEKRKRQQDVHYHFGGRQFPCPEHLRCLLILANQPTWRLQRCRDSRRRNARDARFPGKGGRSGRDLCFRIRGDDSNTKDRASQPHASRRPFFVRIFSVRLSAQCNAITPLFESAHHGSDTGSGFRWLDAGASRPLSDQRQAPCNLPRSARLQWCVNNIRWQHQ